MDPRHGTVYVDNAGCVYAVMGNSVYRARRALPDKTGWHAVQGLPPRTTPEAAQEDLDNMANARGWEKQP